MCTQYLAWTCSKIIFNFKTIWVYIEKRWLLESRKAVSVYSEYDLKRKPLRLTALYLYNWPALCALHMKSKKETFNFSWSPDFLKIDILSNFCTCNPLRYWKALFMESAITKLILGTKVHADCKSDQILRKYLPT